MGKKQEFAAEWAESIVSDALYVKRLRCLWKAMMRAMNWMLASAGVVNILAIPIAAGVLDPRFGIMLRPEWSALLMSVSSIIVAVNAVLLRGVER